METQHTRMRGDERRAYILAQAKKIFAEKSYWEASTGELARASGITEPVLYKHFGSKKQLFIALLSMISGQFLQRFRNRIEARTDLSDRLANLLLDYRAAAMEDHDSIHFLMNAVLELKDPEIAQLIQTHNQETFALIYDLLEKAQAQGLVSSQLDLSVATWGYQSFLVALQYRAKASLFEEFDARTISEINRLWLQALKIA